MLPISAYISDFDLALLPRPFNAKRDKVWVLHIVGLEPGQVIHLLSISPGLEGRNFLLSGRKRQVA